MTRRLLGRLTPDDDPPFPKVDRSVPVFGDTEMSPDADPWMVREADCWVTSDCARGRLSEEFSYRFRQAELGEPFEASFTWGGMLRRAMFEAGDPGPVECQYSAEKLAIREHEAGPHFLAWSPTRVYFPVKYDGDVWVESAPRNPANERLYPVGGG